MSKISKSNRKEQFLTNRKNLIALSLMMREMVESGEADSINEALKDSYIEENPDIEEFKTFGQWKAEGCTIKKGSKAFLIWGQPRKVEQAPEGSEEPKEFKYWPICYLFANTQVLTPEEKKPAQQTPGETQAEPEAVEIETLLN